MDRQKKAYIFALSAVLFWSTAATAFKITLEAIDIISMLWISSLTSLLFLTIFVVLKKRKEFKTLDLRTISKSVFLGFLNPFLYYIILFKAYSLLSAQEALTLNYTWAIFVVILSIPLLKQKISKWSLIAVLIGFTGVIIIATRGNPMSLDLSHPTGVLTALGSSVIWALYWILNTKDQCDALLRLMLNFFFGLIFLLIYTMIYINIVNINTTGLIGGIYIGLFEMGITFVFWLYALKLTKTTAQVSNLIFLSPFLSLFIINLILGEKILFSTIIGLVFVIIGIAVQRMNDVKILNRRV